MSLSNYSLNDLGIEISSDLANEDKKVLFRVGYVKTLAAEMKQPFSQHLGIPVEESNKTKPLLLKIVITRCSEGDRCGRICCAELGMGWVVFAFHWSIVDAASGKVLKAAVQEKYHDAGE